MDARRTVMRRYRNLLIVGLAAAATGCIYGREPVRDDRRIDTPPPPPPVADYPTDSGHSAPQSYQNETPPPPAGSDVSSEAVFYERLSPYGYWMFVAPYGRVWVPAVGYGWRPYYYGQWVLTDWGWTFVSDDPWGWAAYHYGRWNWGSGGGWYWIPGYERAPATGYWRSGGGSRSRRPPWHGRSAYCCRASARIADHPKPSTNALHRAAVGLRSAFVGRWRSARHNRQGAVVAAAEGGLATMCLDCTRY